MPTNSAVILYPLQAVADLFTQALFYGLYLPTFFNCLRWLLFETDESWKFRPFKQLMWPYVVVTILVFAMATANIGIAFLATRADLTGDLPLADVLTFTAVAIRGIALIIIDTVLIYRCWAVYGKSWRIIFLPMVLWACTVTCAVVWTVLNSIGSKLIQNPKNITIIVVVFFTCNFATNVYATSAIVYRVWKIAVASEKHSRLNEICRLLSGTGILYSFTSLLSVLGTIWAVRDSFPLVIFNSINFPAACIAYNLVIIRVGQLRAEPRAAASNVLVYNSSNSPPAYVVTRGADSNTQLSK